MKKLILSLLLLYATPSHAEEIADGPYKGLGIMVGTMYGCSQLERTDLQLHCIAGGALSTGTKLIARKKEAPKWLGFYVGCGFGIGNEIYDHNVEDRVGDPDDAVITCVAAALTNWGMNDIIEFYDSTEPPQLFFFNYKGTSRLGVIYAW